MGGPIGYEVEAGTCLTAMVPKFDPEFEVFCALKNYGLARVLVTRDPSAKSGLLLDPDKALCFRTPHFDTHSLSIVAGERPGYVQVGVLAFRKEPGAPSLPDATDPVALCRTIRAKEAILDPRLISASLPVLHAAAVATGKASPLDVVMHGGLSPAGFGEFLAALRGLRAGGRLVVGEAS
jgi:hypothetical protein